MGEHKPWCGDYRVDCEMAGVYNGPVPCICERRSGEDRRKMDMDRARHVSPGAGRPGVWVYANPNTSRWDVERRQADRRKGSER